MVLLHLYIIGGKQDQYLPPIKECFESTDSSKIPELPLY